MKEINILDVKRKKKKKKNPQLLNVKQILNEISTQFL